MRGDVLVHALLLHLQLESQQGTRGKRGNQQEWRYLRADEDGRRLDRKLGCSPGMAQHQGHDVELLVLGPVGLDAEVGRIRFVSLLLSSSKNNHHLQKNSQTPSPHHTTRGRPAIWGGGGGCVGHATHVFGSAFVGSCCCCDCGADAPPAASTSPALPSCPGGLFAFAAAASLAGPAAAPSGTAGDELPGRPALLLPSTAAPESSTGISQNRGRRKGAWDLKIATQQAVWRGNGRQRLTGTASPGRRSLFTDPGALHRPVHPLPSAVEHQLKLQTECKTLAEIITHAVIKLDRTSDLIAACVTLGEGRNWLFYLFRKGVATAGLPLLYPSAVWGAGATACDEGGAGRRGASLRLDSCLLIADPAFWTPGSWYRARIREDLTPTQAGSASAASAGSFCWPKRVHAHRRKQQLQHHVEPPAVCGPGVVQCRGLESLFLVPSGEELSPPRPNPSSRPSPPEQGALHPPALLHPHLVRG